MSNYSFCHNVFKSGQLQERQKASMLESVNTPANKNSQCLRGVNSRTHDCIWPKIMSRISLIHVHQVSLKYDSCLPPGMNYKQRIKTYFIMAELWKVLVGFNGGEAWPFIFESKSLSSVLLSSFSSVWKNKYIHVMHFYRNLLNIFPSKGNLIYTASLFWNHYS